MKQNPYYHYENNLPVGTNYGRGKWCYDCNFGHTPNECGSNPKNKEDDKVMYQICLVIKEDMKEEIGSMLISGHESLSEVAEEMLTYFAELQELREIEKRVDEAIVELDDLIDRLNCDI